MTDPACHQFDPAILREYDIRGVYGRTLDKADAWALGRVFASHVRRAGGTCVAVGYDGRLHSPALEAALVAGLLAGGADVRRIGLAPTPLLYFAVASDDQVHGGIEITGSHNPKDHNGFKIQLGRQPVFGEAIVDLAHVAALGDWHDPHRIGHVKCVDCSEAWIAHALAALDGVDPAPLAHVRVGWDAGNGAAGPLIERLVERLPGRHVLLHTRVDGHFPNHHPDPTVIENLADLIAAVEAQSIDFGFAFDGDGDRLGVVDGRGRVLWGDSILAILVQDMLPRHRGARIMADVKSSQVVFDRIAALGGTALVAPTGHSLIKAGMARTGALMAGEMTGHIFCADGNFGHDDALYAALRLLAASARLGRSLTELVDDLPVMHATPDMRFGCAPHDPRAVVAATAAALSDAGATIDTTDGVRVTRAEGWWLLRSSNTEALLTARAESADQAGLAALLGDLDRHLARCGVAR